MTEQRITSRKNPLLQQVKKLLSSRKAREEAGLFAADGVKLLGEAVRWYPGLDTVILSEGVHADVPESVRLFRVPEDVMASISPMESPQGALFLCRLPEKKAYEPHPGCLLLDGIQDPGNLGTILRVADWFGIRYVFCDMDCAGAFSPKCVQASMGAVFRVKTIYTNLVGLLKKFSSPEFHCYGTFLNGENIYKTELSAKGFIIMGNEGRGICPELESCIDSKLTIPSFADSTYSTESLNVGVATGIILSEFKRNN